MQTQSPLKTGLLEQPGYFTVPGAHLYTVLHAAEEPVARVLLAGAFASERHFAYHSWVRWARFLAARGIEVLRYDYRGIGESTGVFDEAGFENWSEDVQLLAESMENQSPRLPLVLHGLELGAIFAGQSFDRGVGDALLLWAPPANANQVLRSILQRWCGLEQLYESPDNRKSTSEYIRLMEQGASVEVQGYSWRGRLWRDSFDCCLPANLSGETASPDRNRKPAKTMRFGKNPASLAMPYSRFEDIKDLNPLYAETFDWIAGALALPIGRTQ